MNHRVFGVTLFNEKSNAAYPIILKGRIFKYTLPLHYALPLKTTRLDNRCGLIVELTSQSGWVVYGEAAALPDFSQESLADAERELKSCITGLLNNKARRSMSLDNLTPSASFAIESVLWGFELNQWRPVPAVAPLLLGSAIDIQKKLIHQDGLCPDEFKLKVARGTVAEDVQSVINILSVLPNHVRLRLDANQRWTLEQALSFHSLLIEEGRHRGENLAERIVYIEEPTANIKDFLEFYRKTGIGYAFDESLQQGHELDIADQKGLKAIVIKPTLTGGLRYCRTLFDAARANGVRVVFSSAFESVIGIHWLQQLSALWTPEEMPGLDTSSVFADNLVEHMPSPGNPLPDTAIHKMELLWELSAV